MTNNQNTPQLMEYYSNFRDAMLFSRLSTDKAVEYQRALNNIQGSATSEPNSEEFNKFFENLSTEELKVQETIITELLLKRYNYPIVHSISFRSNIPFTKNGDKFWIGFDGKVRNTPVYTKTIKSLKELTFNEQLYILLTK